MFKQVPKNPNGILVVTDLRLKNDRQLDDKEGGEHVLEFFTPMRAALGPKVWERTARMALFDHGESFEAQGKVEVAAVAERRVWARRHMQEAILAFKPRMIICLGTRTTAVRSKEAEAGGAKGHKGCAVWKLFKAPDSISKMPGCLWKSPLGPVVGVPHPGSQEFVHGWNFRNWVVRAAKYSLDPSILVSPERSSIHAGHVMTHYLKILLDRARGGTPISVDIESFCDGSTITCLGLSDGDFTVSVPWESYVPYGRNDVESAAPESVKSLANDILRAPCMKILHNGIAFDGPLLQAHGSTMNGPIFDTMLAHGALFNQFRHGLQYAASQAFLVEPWKSVYRAAAPRKLNESDSEFWKCNPPKLRTYNIGDSFITWHLFDYLQRRLA